MGLFVVDLAKLASSADLMRSSAERIYSKAAQLFEQAKDLPPGSRVLVDVSSGLSSHREPTLNIGLFSVIELHSLANTALDDNQYEVRYAKNGHDVRLQSGGKVFLGGKAVNLSSDEVASDVARILQEGRALQNWDTDYTAMKQRINHFVIVPPVPSSTTDKLVAGAMAVLIVIGGTMFTKEIMRASNDKAPEVPVRFK